MKKHGLSNGLSVPFSVLVGAWIVGIIYSQIPAKSNYLDILSRKLVTIFKLEYYGPESISILIVATLIAAVWGGVFSFLHKD